MAMKTITHLLSVLLITNVIVEGAKDLPDYIQKCHRNDPKVSECLLKATDQIRPYLIKGIPELNIPPIEPLFVPQIKLEQGTSALNFKALLHDVYVHGLSNYKCSKFDFDVPNLQWFIDATVQPVKLKGKYNVTGRILIAPIQGNGNFEAEIVACNVTGYQKAQLVTKKGHEYLSAIVTNSSIDVGGPQVKLDGLFDGNENLSQITNKVINDNINELFQDLRPVIETIITQLLEKTILDTLEYQVPYDSLYPPN